MPDDRRIKVIVPIPMDAPGVASRAAQLPADFVRPGFVPEFVAVPWGAALGDSYHDRLLMDWTVFQSGITAEDEGYSGVLIDTVSDSGLRALRSRLTIPVIGPGEAAFAAAMMLGKNGHFCIWRLAGFAICNARMQTPIIRRWCGKCWHGSYWAHQNKSVHQSKWVTKVIWV